MNGSSYTPLFLCLRGSVFLFLSFWFLLFWLCSCILHFVFCFIVSCISACKNCNFSSSSSISFNVSLSVSHSITVYHSEKFFPPAVNSPTQTSFPCPWPMAHGLFFWFCFGLFLYADHYSFSIYTYIYTLSTHIHIYLLFHCMYVKQSAHYSKKNFNSHFSVLLYFSSTFQPTDQKIFNFPLFCEIFLLFSTPLPHLTNFSPSYPRVGFPSTSLFLLSA